MQKFMFILFVSILSVSTIYADDYIDMVKKGNEAFTENKFNEALDFYHSAEPELPESAELEYNLAGALYQKGNYQEALERYTEALNTTDLNLEAEAHYNLGNTHFNLGDYQNAITSYQNSLMINPEDIDAKYNLELARKMLKEQMQNKEQQQDQQNQNQDKKEQEQQKQEGDDKQEGEQEQNQQQQKDQEEKEGANKSEAQKQKEAEEKAAEERKKQELSGKKMSKEDALRILNGIKDNEEKQQKKLQRKVYNQQEYDGNDW